MSTKILTYNAKPIDYGGYIPPFSYTRSGQSDGPASYGRYIWKTKNDVCLFNNLSKCMRFQPSENTWSNVESAQSVLGSYMWSDGVNDYYSYGSTQYTVSYTSSLAGVGFTPKTWTGLTSFYKGGIWSDGDNFYYSDGSTQYVLDISNSAWTPKTWNGLSSFYGGYVWDDGNNCYYSDGSNQYVLDKSTDTWYPKNWNGITSFSGSYIWKLGDKIYCSSGPTHYSIDTSTSRVQQVYPGISFLGYDVWSYRGITYVSQKDTPTYILSENVIAEYNFISYQESE